MTGGGSRGRAIVAAAALTSACSYPDFGFVPDDAIDAVAEAPAADTSTPGDSSTDDASDTATDAIIDATDATTDGVLDTAPCPILEGADLCKTIPKLPAGITQVMDGIGDDFCKTPAHKLVANAAPYMDPKTPPPGIDTVMWTRVAWSAASLHVHIRVDQSPVYPPTSTEELWRGDGIELFASGLSVLTGEYSSTTDVGTFQFIAAGPQPPAVARALVYQGTDGPQTFLDPSHFAARITPTGYEIEMKIDWVDLKATPTSGKVVGFTAGVDVRHTAGSALKLQSFLGYRTVTATTPCGSTRGPHPSCDDRTWCVPTLE